MLRHKIELSDKNFSSFPLTFLVTLMDSPGPSIENGVITTKYSHSLKIIITDDYPYQTPIVRWTSPIFHPNIMGPEEGGYVCTRLLKEWDFSSNLVSFIKGIESLLSNPNPDNPFESQGCTQAAEYFNKNSYCPEEIHLVKRKPIILEDNGGEIDD